jgi:integrase
VLAKLEEARQLVGAGVTDTSGTTVESFLTSWLELVVAARVGDNTADNYRTVIEHHVIPALGSIPLSKLTAEDVDRFLARKARRYSRSYVVRMRTLLVDALAHADKRGLVVRNVAALSVMPKTKKGPERRSLTPDELRQLLNSAAGDRLEAMVVVGVNLALRPGEMTGLLWEDLDPDGGTLAITGSMKRLDRDSTLYRGEVKRSTAGVRTLAVPPAVLAALAAHRTRQKVERLAAGEDWHDHGLVFCSELGTPLDPSNVRRTFSRIGQKAGIFDAIPYLLRHTGVSLLLDAGATIEEVADLTGDDPGTLYRHYRHKVRPVVTVAAERMGTILGA